MSRKKQGLKGYLHPSVHFNTVYSSQDMKATDMSTDRWMGKEDVAHADSVEYYSAFKNINH